MGTSESPNRNTKQTHTAYAINVSFHESGAIPSDWLRRVRNHYLLNSLKERVQTCLPLAAVSPYGNAFASSNARILRLTNDQRYKYKSIH